MSKSGRYKKKTHIVCPHCNLDFEEEDFDVDGQIIEPYSDGYSKVLSCLSCFKQFEMTLNMKIQYTTRKI